MNLANNLLSTTTDLVHLLQVPSIVTLDIQYNKIDDEQVIDLILSRLLNLRVLYLQGNPVVSKIPHYRKTILSRCKQLLYLDDRPVYEEERRRVEVWSQAYQLNKNYHEARLAELEAIGLMKQESLSLDAKNAALFAKIVQEGQSKRVINESVTDTERSMDSPVRGFYDTLSDASASSLPDSPRIEDRKSSVESSGGHSGCRKFLQLLDDTAREGAVQTSSKIRLIDKPNEEDLMSTD